MTTTARRSSPPATSPARTGAAEALHVTQPTLSAQVKSLEESYGVLLFDRRGRRTEPTELGRQLLAVTRRYFGLETEAEQLLAATRALRGGLLRVGADARSEEHTLNSSH